MEWRVFVELSGVAGAAEVHQVHAGGVPASECSAATLGLTLTEAKAVLAGLQRHLVQAQAEEHCQTRRRCSHCGAKRPLKDRRRRRLRSLFGTVEVRAPRFSPCRCRVTVRTTLAPVTEIMPDRCTPEYERVLAKLGALLPYRRARAVLVDFFPIGECSSDRYDPSADFAGWREARARGDCGAAVHSDKRGGSDRTVHRLWSRACTAELPGADLRGICSADQQRRSKADHI